jgi:hypothetical protein
MEGAEMKFRKKPVVIEAMQFTGKNAFSMMRWVQEAAREADWRIADGCIYIRTLEGEMRADPGDWIIVGVKGEQYPCKPDIFEQTYEAATNE